MAVRAPPGPALPRSGGSFAPVRPDRRRSLRAVRNPGRDESSPVRPGLRRRGAGEPPRRRRGGPRGSRPPGVDREAPARDPLRRLDATASSWGASAVGRTWPACTMPTASWRSAVTRPANWPRSTRPRVPGPRSCRMRSATTFARAAARTCVGGSGVDREPILLTVARYSARERYKGYDRVVGALPAVLARRPDTRYVLVGEGDDLRASARWPAASGGPRRGLRRRGARRGAAAWYNACDLFVMPSQREVSASCSSKPWPAAGRSSRETAPARATRCWTGASGGWSIRTTPTGCRGDPGVLTGRAPAALTDPARLSRECLRRFGFAPSRNGSGTWWRACMGDGALQRLRRFAPAMRDGARRGPVPTRAWRGQAASPPPGRRATRRTPPPSSPDAA